MKVSDIHEREGYVEILLEGAFTSADISTLLPTCADASTRKGGHRLLLNFLAVTVYRISTLDRYNMGMAAAQLPKGMRLATVLQPEWIDPEHFGARVAQNRGAEVDVFSDRKQALEWLLRKDGPPAPEPPQA